ncbi:MAG: DNA polymerase IV [Planctomycetota bacterium]|nr:DNA polymerase IV [Planctomycetota bacterium]MEC8559744.1 DNA polymerase IV [Planctomycetota bacterium]MEC8817459.1 DNA polymerase IV [Planctomycetota bacterium]MEC9157488.1 DNA polymerase IV [Planctomycetota bacterium]MEC9233366.1 DNA polymerase IV [Planctomycetota bacterium]
MESPRSRTILHCDLDAFFASVEQMDDPSLRGRPVLVGGTGLRGVVAAASYEARRFGCRSAMPTSIALQRCPDAVLLPGRSARYGELSRQFMSILEDASPLVEPLSLDEAFVDVTGSRRLLGDGVQIARWIRQRTLDEVGLVVSIGVAPNKFVAKIASDLEKPDALCVIEPSGLAERLASLPIERMWGLGPRSVERFRLEGFSTFGDLQRSSPGQLAARFGDSAARFHSLSLGIDERPLAPERTAKSIGQERTFGEDISELDTLRGILLGEVEQVAERLRRKGSHATRVTLKIRFGDFQTITRSRTLGSPTSVTGTLWEAGLSVFEDWARTQFRPVRLLGFTVSGFDGPDAPSLFPDPGDERGKRIDDVTDRIHDRFGEASISRAKSVRRERRDR